MALYPTTCDQCGATDPDPKWTDGVVQKHHDCMSMTEKAYVSSTNPRAAEIIQACVDGLRGDALREFIQALPSEGVLQ